MLQSLPAGVKLVVENERAHLQLPLNLLGPVLDALSASQALQAKLPGRDGAPMLRPRTLVEPQLVGLTSIIGPTWFAILCTLYDAHAIQPNPVLKVRDLAGRAGVSETKIYRCVREYREGAIRPERVQELVRHFVLDIHAHEGGNSPNQFVLRELAEAIATCPVIPPLADPDTEAGIAPPSG